MLAIAEGVGHYSMYALAEERGWHYLPGLGDVEGTSSQKQTNKQTIMIARTLSMMTIRDITRLLVR